MDKPILRIGQMGVGYWGPNLLRNLVAEKRCEVRAVTDVSAERRGFVQRLYPAVATVAAPAGIIADPDIDAVVISTPAATHFDLAVRCLEAGKHVLVEKPLARTVEEVDRIASVAARAGRVAMVGHTFIFNPAVRYLKKLVATGVVGDIRYVFSQRVNLGRIRSDVDALWNLAPHDVSIIQYLLDNASPSSVSRCGMDYIQKGVEDVVFLHIRYPGQVMAHVHVSWLDPLKVRRMTVVGTKKMVVYDDVADDKIAIYDKGIEPRAVVGERMDYDKGPVPQFEHRSGDIVLPRIPAGEPLGLEIGHFVECIVDGVTCETGTAHARGVVGILEQAARKGTCS